MKGLLLIWKFTKITLLALVILLVVYFGLALILSLWSVNRKNLACVKTHRIHVSSNGVHTDIILPVAELDDAFIKQFIKGSNTGFIAFGWGDKGFYLDTPTWAELKVSTAIKAMLINSPTAMHVTEHRSAGTDWKSLSICEEQYDTILEHIRTSFQKGEDGEVMEIIGTGYTDHDRFYEAIGNYTGIRTCNVWVNQGLKKARVKTAVWSPFQHGIMYHLE